MDITLNKKDDLNATITIKVAQDDYQEKVDNVLKDYRKKANIPGFRPGKVPMGYVKKMYGKAILVDEINKILSESLVEYIRKEELNILGEPLPSEESENNPIDWDTQKEFEFTFDIANSPEFEVKLSKREKINFYELKADDKLIDDTIQNYAYRNGSNKPVDEVKDLDETLRGDLIELDGSNNPLEDGINRENALMSLHVMKDDKVKELFKGKKAKDSVDFDLRTAYPNDTEISSLLDITKEEAAELKSNFRITINEINKFEPAEVNQELYDKLYGEGEIKSDEEFKEKVVEEIKNSFRPQSEYKFLIDAKDKIVSKIGLELPDEFLKRWLDATNKELDKAKIEEEYESFQKDMQWQLIVDKIYKTNDFKIEDSEIMDFAKESTRQQFMQYGLSYIPDEQLENYSKEIVSKPEERRKIIDKLVENKVLDFIKESVKIENKEVTMEEFNNFFK
jgi:trigger factor